MSETRCCDECGNGNCCNIGHEMTVICNRYKPIKWDNTEMVKEKHTCGSCPESSECKIYKSRLIDQGMDSRNADKYSECPPRRRWREAEERAEKAEQYIEKIRKACCIWSGKKGRGCIGETCPGWIAARYGDKKKEAGE